MERDKDTKKDWIESERIGWTDDSMHRWMNGYT